VLLRLVVVLGVLSRLGILRLAALPYRHGAAGGIWPPVLRISAAEAAVVVLGS
jgi:hypothetical protein